MQAKEIRRIARENLKGNWGISVGVTLVAALLGGMVTGGGGGSGFKIDEAAMENLPPVAWQILIPIVSLAALLGLVTFIIGGVVELGHAKFLLKQCKREQLQFADLFSQFNRFGTGFAQQFLRGLYVALWALLLVVPGIIKALSYSMTPFILEDHPEMTASQAITASRTLMDGHKWEYFCLSLSFIGWQILAALTMGIGFLFVNPYQNAAAAVFYQNISGQRAETKEYLPPVEF